MQVRPGGQAPRHCGSSTGSPQSNCGKHLQGSPDASSSQAKSCGHSPPHICWPLGKSSHTFCGSWQSHSPGATSTHVSPATKQDPPQVAIVESKSHTSGGGSRQSHSSLPSIFGRHSLGEGQGPAHIGKNVSVHCCVCGPQSHLPVSELN